MYYITDMDLMENCGSWNFLWYFGCSSLIFCIPLNFTGFPHPRVNTAILLDCKRTSHSFTCSSSLSALDFFFFFLFSEVGVWVTDEGAASLSVSLLLVSCFLCKCAIKQHFFNCQRNQSCEIAARFLNKIFHHR